MILSTKYLKINKNIYELKKLQIVIITKIEFNSNLFYFNQYKLNYLFLDNLF